MYVEVVFIKGVHQHQNRVIVPVSFQGVSHKSTTRELFIRCIGQTQMKRPGFGVLSGEEVPRNENIVSVAINYPGMGFKPFDLKLTLRGRRCDERQKQNGVENKSTRDHDENRFIEMECWG